MNEQLVQEILDRLDKTGELAVEGFGILMRQVYVEVVQLSVAAVLLTVGAVVCYRLIKNFGYFGGEQIWCKDIYDSPELGAGLLGALGVFCAVCSVLAVMNIIAKLLNPEFYALRYILNSVR